MSNPVLPWLGGSIAYVFVPRSRRDDCNTADGGRPSRIDLLVDAGVRNGETSPQSKFFPEKNVVNKG